MRTYCESATRMPVLSVNLLAVSILPVVVFPTLPVFGEITRHQVGLHLQGGRVGNGSLRRAGAAGVCVAERNSDYVTSPRLNQLSCRAHRSVQAE